MTSYKASRTPISLQTTSCPDCTPSGKRYARFGSWQLGDDMAGEVTDAEKGIEGTLENGKVRVMWTESKPHGITLEAKFGY
ncbi:hypothetical protein LMH87_007500 [Akanthomyces muscarius]|uniref:Uncharacterized protein n=1 Tax=Akanthomyces muscarius TaxID=2231603 RepID=A0A9W8QSE1_AKAMU|nr:hypothetical protein LMH87_007500 [Akanthomyces muscarius]KAJ4165891.1 hypothetical protein LMH87_007500 [Akanthomyces muscarius]